MHLDLVVVVVIAWATVRGLGEGLLWAIVGGLCLDLFSAAPFGSSALALVAAALIAHAIGARVRRTSQPILAVAALPFATLLYYGVAAGLDALVRGQLRLPALAVGVIAPAVALDLLVGPVVLLLAFYLARLTTRTPYL